MRCHTCTRRIIETGRWLALREVGGLMCRHCASSAYGEGLAPDQERMIRAAYAQAGLPCPLQRNNRGFAVFPREIVEIRYTEED